MRHANLPLRAASFNRSPQPLKAAHRGDRGAEIVPSRPQPTGAQLPLRIVATPPAASRGARRPSAQSTSTRSAAVDTGSTIVRANRATADTSRDATKPQREQTGRLGRIIFVACNRDATELPPCIHPGMHARLSLHRLADRAVDHENVPRAPHRDALPVPIHATRKSSVPPLVAAALLGTNAI